jgi:prepilin-type N-terminal cleavage/methylation domain-containing protein
LPQKKTINGFTLIEMIVVVSILSILTTIVLPNLSRWYASIKINGARRDLISDLRLIQQNTVTSQTNHSIQINVPQNKYSLTKKNSPDEIIKTVNLPEGITISALNLVPEVTEIEFNAAGAPTAIGTITVSNYYGITKTVEVTPSGFVKEQ